MQPHLRIAAAMVTSLVLSPAVAQDGGRVVHETILTPGIEAAPAETGAAGQLMYTPISPCRLLDTRQPSLRSGPLLTRGERDFLVYDADLAAEQGGAEGGCGLPANAQAVSVNLTAVQPESPGYITAWAYGEDRPLASSLNLVPGENLSNAITVPVNTASAEPDLMVYAHVQTHLVADVVGYYTPPEAAPLQCVSRRFGDGLELLPGFRGGEYSPQCNAGWTPVGGWCDVKLSEDMRVIEARLTNIGHLCVGRNTGTEPERIHSSIQCCRLPAR